jgi:hypothetical protein
MVDLEVSFPKPCDERWDGMQRVGCNRHCASCDTIVHDLEAYRFDEIAALVSRGEEVCVRARIGADGEVALKPGGRRTGRLILAASAGMLAITSPAYAQPKGKIVGKVDGHQVIATDEAGRRYRAALRQDGRFWFRGLPPGKYVVSAHGCTEPWTVGTATVRGGKVELPPSFDPKADECIIVGVIVRKPDAG